MVPEPPRWRRLLAAAWSLLAAPGLRWLDVPIAAGIAWLAWTRLQEVCGDTRVFPLTADTSPWMLASVGAYHLDATALALQGRLPGYPLAVALAWRLGAEPMAGALGVSRVAWALLPAAVWLGGVRTGGRVGAALAASLMLVSRPLAEAAGMINSQSLFNLAFALFVGLAPALLEGDRAWRRVVFGALAAGLLVVKEQGVLALALAGALACLSALARPGPGRVARAVREGVLVTGGASFCLAPLVALSVAEYRADGRIPKLLLPASDFLDTHGWYNPFTGLPGTGLAPVVGTHTITTESHIGARAFEIFAAHLDGLVPVAAAGLIVALLLGDARRRLTALWLLAQLAPLGPALALGFFYPYHLSFLIAPLALLGAHGVGAALGTPLRGRWRWLEVLARAGALVALGGVARGARPVETSVREWEASLRANRDPDAAAGWIAMADALATTTPPGAWVVAPEAAVAVEAHRAYVDVGQTPLNPSFIAARSAGPQCDVYAAYLPDGMIGAWATIRLQGEDQVPLGWTLHWRSPVEGRHRGVIARYPGANPDGAACHPDDPRFPSPPPPRRASPAAAVPPGARGPPLGPGGAR